MKSDASKLLEQAFERIPGAGERQRVAFANFRDWQSQNDVFQEIAAFRFDTPTVAGGQEPARTLGIKASATIFPLLHMRMAIGRAFTAEEESINPGILSLRLPLSFAGAPEPRRGWNS